MHSLHNESVLEQEKHAQIISSPMLSVDMKSNLWRKTFTWTTSGIFKSSTVFQKPRYKFSGRFSDCINDNDEEGMFPCSGGYGSQQIAHRTQFDSTKKLSLEKPAQDVLWLNTEVINNDRQV